MKAIALVSGGLDSCVATAWAVKQFGASNVIPINFAYGQRHAREIVASEQICEALHLQQPRTFNLQQAFTLIGGSSLTSGIRDGNPSTEEVSRTESSLPPTFVPGRNIIMIAVAASLAYTEKATKVVGGWNAVDYSGYPDCRPEFFGDMQDALITGLDLPAGRGFPVTAPDYPQSKFFRLCAPLIHLNKREIIELGLQLGAPLELSWSCYSGGSEPCGICDSCKIRIDGFAETGIADPALG